MKIQDLEAKIATRADAVVNAKIKAFKSAIDDALAKLFGKTSSGIDQFGYYSYGEDPKRYPLEHMKLQALKMACLDHSKDGGQYGKKLKLLWPKALWDQEREAIRNELLSKMDLMQQLLMTPDVSDVDRVTCEGDSAA